MADAQDATAETLNPDGTGHWRRQISNQPCGHCLLVRQPVPTAVNAQHATRIPPLDKRRTVLWRLWAATHCIVGGHGLNSSRTAIQMDVTVPVPPDH